MVTDNYGPDDGPTRSAGRAMMPISPSTALVRDPYRALAPYPGMEQIDEGLGTKLLGYWRMVVKRRWLIASCVVAVTALGVLRALLTTPLYTSTVRLQIDRSAAKVVETGNIAGPGEAEDSEFLRTQLELLLSRSISERAVRNLHLADRQDAVVPAPTSLIGSIRGFLFGDMLGEAKPDAAARERALTKMVIESRSVRQLPGSRLVDVSYSDPSPAMAQLIVNAIADAYISSNIDKRFDANSYAKTFLEDQTKQLKLRLEESEKALLDFAQKEQIVAVNEKSSSAETNLAAANTALGVLVSDRIKSEQLWKQVEVANAINLPQLLTNSVIDGLRARKNAMSTEYQQKLETYKPDYPAMVQIRNQINEVNRQLASEVKTSKESYKSAYEAALKQESEMKFRIDALKIEALDLQQRSIQYNILKRETDTNRGLYESLLQRYKQVDIAGGSGANNIFVVDTAEVAQSPSSPNIPRTLALFLGLGLAAGLGAAFLLEHLDDTVRSMDELERVGGLTPLGLIPKLASGAKVETELENLRSATSEAYRSLCTALQFSTEAGLPKTLLVTSAVASEGKSSTAIAIARHFASIGLKVLLIDGDLRKASLHTKLQLENSNGLSNYLTGACDLADAICASGRPNLSIMTAGPLPPNSAELLGGSRVVSLLTQCSEVFNLVIVDSAPVLGLADAPLLASNTAGTVFVVGAGKVKVRAVRDAARRLAMSRGHVVGAVLTGYDAMAAGYGYGYDNYGSNGYGYGDLPMPANAPPALEAVDATPPGGRDGIRRWNS